MKNNQEISLNNIDPDNDAYNDFYASVSVLFRIASFIFLVAFLIFIVYSAFGSQEAITYDNLEYLVRNFALTLDENRDDSVYAIRYNPDSSRSFALVGNKFALCGNSGIAIYSSTGRQTCSDSFAFKNPIMVTSDKYALIYDSGNFDLVIYNSFTKVHSQTLSKPIRGACMSQSGYYAVITSSNDYNSTVEVYDADFKLINRFNKNGYVVDVDMRDDRILITTVEGSDDYTSYDLQMLVYDIAEDKTVSSVELTASFPLSCKMSSSGFFLICKDEAIIYDISGEKSNVLSYNGSILADFDLTYDTAVILLDESRYDISFSLTALDGNAAVLYEYNIDFTVHDIELCGNTSCLLMDNQVLVLNAEIENIISVDGLTTDCQLLACDTKTLYLCTNTAAPLIDIAD